MPAAEQAQSTAEAAVHQLAVAAATDLNKLSRALQQAGVSQDTVSQVDEMANTCNDLASAGVGNTGDQPAPETPTNAATPAPDALTGAIQDFHNQSVAGAAA